MKKISSIAFVIIAAIFLSAFDNGRGVESNGAPIAATGAPSEQTCAKSGCHSDNAGALNQGSAQFSLDYNNGVAQYEPGNIYHITVSLAQTNIQRFGFELTALKNSDSTEAGTMLITDNTRTQIFQGVAQYAERNYVTYTYLGTSASSSGEDVWSFDWQAPSSDAGAITFYCAGVAANNDGTDGGDSVYTKQLTLQASPAGIKEESNSALSLHVFPNPAKENLNIAYTVNEPSNTEIVLRDLLSRKTFTLLNRFDDSGEKKFSANISSQFSEGIYLLTITSGKNSVTKKIMVEQ